MGPPGTEPSPAPEPSAGAGARWAAWAVETLVWAALLVGVWVLTLSSVATSEMAAAGGSGVLCGAVATAARRAVGGRWRPPAAVLRWTSILPAAVPTDTARVLGVAARAAGRRLAGRDPGEFGRFVLTPFDPVVEAGAPPAGEAATAGRRALAVLAVSLTPGSYVVDTREDALVVHSLVQGRPSMQKAVGRKAVGRKAVGGPAGGGQGVGR